MNKLEKHRHPGKKGWERSKSMPRLGRLDAPGVLQHVMIRGIEGRDIFSDNKGRDNLL
ncbi:hypothetical protein PITCH_A510006 [uncultured Desulfobacterium sp.]|uniref:Transposase n=1 Tax=uncultured Desulfobacterium sp. TaxID=201089 RepID=A0A445N102_9BACT|nr:hypothetical protein PITCH_A510006 [uncultured Desulfobacterium sp.]